MKNIQKLVNQSVVSELENIIVKSKGGKIIEKAELLSKGEITFKEKADKYEVDGPEVYLKKLLWTKGPLTSHQMWLEYLKDKQKEQEYFKSKTHLKQRVLKKLISEKQILKVGYDKEKLQFIGYKVEPNLAFKNFHPDLLLALNPVPSISRFYYHPDVIYRREENQKEQKEQKN